MEEKLGKKKIRPSPCVVFVRLMFYLFLVGRLIISP